MQYAPWSSIWSVQSMQLDFSATWSSPLEHIPHVHCVAWHTSQIFTVHHRLFYASTTISYTEMYTVIVTWIGVVNRCDQSQSIICSACNSAIGSKNAFLFHFWHFYSTVPLAKMSASWDMHGDFLWAMMVTMDRQADHFIPCTCFAG